MIQDFFRNLNPYGIYIEDMFKVEDNRSEKKKVPRIIDLRNILYYGIFAKRYVIYDFDKNGDIEILKYSSHGLGHLMKIDEIRGVEEHPLTTLPPETKRSTRQVPGQVCAPTVNRVNLPHITEI